LGVFIQNIVAIAKYPAKKLSLPFEVDLWKICLVSTQRESSKRANERMKYKIP